MYTQLIDSTTDDVDSQTLINGSGGLLTRDLIEKPAFFAMKLLAGLKSRLVEVGDGYIITENEEKEISIILYHFIGRNHLYYIKSESENTVEDHYRYFEHLQSRHFTLHLEHLPEQEYVIRHTFVNREHGSVLDEWAQLSCIEAPQPEDVRYLKAACVPKKTLEYQSAKDGHLVLQCDLQPLEMRGITIRKR